MFISLVFLILAWMNYMEGDKTLATVCAAISLVVALIVDKGRA